MSKIKVGFIGAGSMASIGHHPSLHAMEDVEFVAICDLVEVKAKEAADKYGIGKVYTDYREMIDNEALDALYVVTPPQYLFEPVMYALKKKINVFSEKPLGVTAFQAEALARAAKKNDCITMCGYNRRFLPMLTYAKNIFKEKGVKINQAVMTFYKQKPSAIYYEGVIEMIDVDAIHVVDFIRWVSDSEPVAVKSLVSTSSGDVPNIYNAIVKTESGTNCVVLINWDAATRLNCFEMHGHGISMFLNPGENARIIMDGKEKVLTAEEIAKSSEEYISGGFYAESRHFIDCIRSHTKTDSDFESAAKTMRLSEMIKNSAL